MSHELLKHIKDDNTVISQIPSREIFNKSTGKHMTIFEFADTDSNVAREYKSLLEEMPTIFGNILENTK